MTIEVSFELYEEMKDNQGFDWSLVDIEKDDFCVDNWTTDAKEYSSTATVNLSACSPSTLLSLKKAVQAVPTKYLVRGTKSIITKYIAVQEGKVVRASGAKQMQFLMVNLIALHAKRFWIKQEHLDRWYFYGVQSVIFHEEYRERGYFHEAKIEVTCKFTIKGREVRKNFTFGNGECRGLTAEQLLVESGMNICSDDDLVDHDQHFETYVEHATSVGRQMLSRGKAHCGKNLGVNNGAAILVVDVADDKDEDDSNMYDCYRRHRWLPTEFYEIKNRKSDEPILELEVEDYEEEEKLYMQLPVHPLITLFDLRRHTRFEVHIADLEPYVFDKDLHEKLIIDEEVKELINLLSANNNSSFQDVVAGKTGGTTVLLAGPPGVGKTLTAEIYSESVEKPLYRVQCSQLGTNPDVLEDSLLEVFRRANRWKAIILLDESDVYVSKRGESLTKNAIVGVFLRVLEYQENTLFLTTNLPESVDDAIASRCIARIDYSIPKPQDLGKIWQVLAKNAGMELSWMTQSNLIGKFPYLSGRDVKNILKLISARNQAITLEAVEQAAKFHPNRGNWREQGYCE